MRAFCSLCWWRVLPTHRIVPAWSLIQPQLSACCDAPSNTQPWPLAVLQACSPGQPLAGYITAAFELFPAHEKEREAEVKHHRFQVSFWPQSIKQNWTHFHLMSLAAGVAGGNVGEAEVIGSRLLWVHWLSPCMATNFLILQNHATTVLGHSGTAGERVLSDMTLWHLGERVDYTVGSSLSSTQLCHHFGEGCLDRGPSSW